MVNTLLFDTFSRWNLGACVSRLSFWYFLAFLLLLDTTMTNFAAFVLGNTTTLPAVEYFFFYADTAILTDFFLQVGF